MNPGREAQAVRFQAREVARSRESNLVSPDEPFPERSREPGFPPSACLLANRLASCGPGRRRGRSAQV